jgi:hypothetical protein
MSDDLRDLLHEAAARPTRPVDPHQIHAVRCRRQRRERIAGVAAAVLLVVVAVTVWPSPGGAPPVIEDPPEPTVPTPSPDTSSSTDTDEPTPDAAAGGPVVMQSHEWPDGPSQSASDAARDGVLPDIAAMPAGERIGTIDAAVTPEGIWVTSRMPCPNVCADRSFGDPEGAYAFDHVAAREYGELLLLDPASLTIRRAWPLPGMPPNGANANDRLQVTDQAVYFAHQGDGGLPDSYVMRVDRDTLEPVVRIFQYTPGALDDPSTPAREQGLPYPYWSRAPETSDVHIQNGLLAGDETVATIGSNGTIFLLDPVTLQETSRSDPGPDVAPGPRGTLLATAGAPPAEFLDPLDLSDARVDLPPLDLSGMVLDVLDAPDRVAMIVASPDGYRVAAWTRAAGQWTVAALPGPDMGQRTARPTLGEGTDQVVVLHDDIIYRLTEQPPRMQPLATPDRVMRQNPMTPPGAVVSALDGPNLVLLGQGRYWTLPTTSTPVDGPSDRGAPSAAQLNGELRQLLDAAGHTPLGGDHDIGHATETIEVTLDGQPVMIGLGYGTVAVTQPLIADFTMTETYEVRDLPVTIGTWPDGAPGAVVHCTDRTLTLRAQGRPPDSTRPTSNDRGAAVASAADELAAAWDCTGSDEARSSAATDLEDGRHAVYLHGVDTQGRRLTIDVVQWLWGGHAAEAYQADNPGETGGPPNDYYIVNDNPGLRMLPVAEDVTVELVRLHEDGDADLDPATWEELPQYLRGDRTADERLSHNPFWLTIEDQRIVRIEEQYIP